MLFGERMDDGGKGKRFLSADFSFGCSCGIHDTGEEEGRGGEGERTIGDNEVSLNVSADKRAFAF